MQALCTFFVFPGHGQRQSQTRLLTNEIRMQHSFAGFAFAFGLPGLVRAFALPLALPLALTSLTLFVQVTWHRCTKIKRV